MKANHLVNIERLKKKDREALRAIAISIYRSREQILAIQASYEGITHTQLDRIVLELNEALGDLHDLTKLDSDKESETIQSISP